MEKVVVEIQAFIQNARPTLSEFWKEIMQQNHYRTYWLQKKEGALDIEIWRFLRSTKRIQMVKEWEKHHPVLDVFHFHWLSLLQELPWIRVKAIRVLQKMDTTAQIYALILLLESPRWSVKRDAAIRLKQFGAQAKPALPFILKAISDPQKEVRLALIDVLESMGQSAREAIPFLEKELTGPYWEVAKQAKEALKKIQYDFSKDV